MAQRKLERAGTGPPSAPAAVLVPVYRDGAGELRVVVIRRAEHGFHAGQIAFPGGRPEARDGGPVETALREAEEEIGLDPGRVEVLAHLPEIETRASGFVIAPVLGRIQRPATWRPDSGEVAEVLEPEVSDLARPEFRGTALDLLPGWTPPAPLPFMRIGPHRLWGATYRILDPLIPRLLSREWTI